MLAHDQLKSGADAGYPADQGWVKPEFELQAKQTWLRI
jgi:hypothetical protein